MDFRNFPTATALSQGQCSLGTDLTGHFLFVAENFCKHHAETRRVRGGEQFLGICCFSAFQSRRHRIRQVCECATRRRNLSRTASQITVPLYLRFSFNISHSYSLYV